ncbi:hypothetical protein VMUT_1010 [Vulcanisaeta moutnovskia 768-28]|uniref:Uncharacterized protein n=1 Tax=Vulcanisaeta moutnovskia (strain 768-28) TaxID=985053 RepID=F0QXQ4_VULM7|nr:hypothetical protein [Vulcanisaeta moutnovskia]ADY01217.1 hypothetical protein VMUT_1010 [Vulcanisaeta moutnovskia 768-28]
MNSRGISSVATAVVMALTIIAVITFIAISMPLARSIIDKNHWAGEVGVYRPPSPINSSMGINEPTLDGYCLVYTTSNGYYNLTYYSCPSTMNTTTTGQ